MKTISTLISLAAIIAICSLSAILYLNEAYNLSALLNLVWVIGSASWIKSNGFLHDKNVSA